MDLHGFADDKRSIEEGLPDFFKTSGYCHDRMLILPKTSGRCHNSMLVLPSGYCHDSMLVFPPPCVEFTTDVSWNASVLVFNSVPPHVVLHVSALGLC